MSKPAMLSPAQRVRLLALSMRTRNWQEIMAQLAIFFQERLKDYLC